MLYHINSYIIELLQVVLTTTILTLMANIITKNLALPWAPNWHPHMPTSSCPNLEQDHVYTYHLQPILWKRFIDDIFLI